MPADVLLVLHGLCDCIFVSGFEIISRDVTNGVVWVVEMALNTCGDADAIGMGVLICQACYQNWKSRGPGGVFEAVKEVLLILWMFHAAWAKCNCGVFDFGNSKLVETEWLFVVNIFDVGGVVV
jgi:hypothetical protein